MIRRIVILSAAALIGAAASPPLKAEDDMKNIQTHPYLGMWVTGDGQLRQELLPKGSYDAARGNRRQAYPASHEVNGHHIQYRSDQWEKRRAWQEGVRPY